MTKYINPGSPIIDAHIDKSLTSNTLIELGATINVMMKETMEKLKLFDLCQTPMVLWLADRSTAKLEDVVISIDSLEYPTNFMVL
jgi:hypothetical protein